MRIRFLGELNDFLAPARRGRTQIQRLERRAGIKDIIEACGIPHTEIGAIRIDGCDDAGRGVLDEDSTAHVVVAPDVPARPSALRPPVPDPPRFVLDTHLGRLARYLRLAGFDTCYSNDCDDARLAEIAETQSRILLTRDRGLLKRARVVHARFIRVDDPHAQLDDIAAHFELGPRMAPFSRCSDCNTPLEAVDKAEIVHRLAPLTRRYYTCFARCPACDKLYWSGSHAREVRGWLERMARVGSAG